MASGTVYLSPVEAVYDHERRLSLSLFMMTVCDDRWAVKNRMFNNLGRIELTILAGRECEVGEPIAKRPGISARAPMLVTFNRNSYAEKYQSSTPLISSCLRRHSLITERECPSACTILRRCKYHLSLRHLAFFEECMVLYHSSEYCSDRGSNAFSTTCFDSSPPTG